MKIEDKLQRGFCYVTLNDGEYIINGLHVRKPYQNQGIASSLIKSAESVIQKLGGYKSILYVIPNSWQHDWYVRIGFRESNNNDVLGFKKLEKNTTLNK